MEEFGDNKWAQIAEKLSVRVGKQCRERWKNHLRPDIRVFIFSLIIFFLGYMYNDFNGFMF